MVGVRGLAAVDSLSLPFAMAFERKNTHLPCCVCGLRFCFLARLNRSKRIGAGRNCWLGRRGQGANKPKSDLRETVYGLKFYEVVILGR